MPLFTAESPVSAVAAFDDDVWEDLLNYIEEKRVIPIVGPELCVVQTDAHSTGSASSGQAGPENLYTWLARSLAARLGQISAADPPPPTLNDVVVRHLSSRAAARISMRAFAPSCASRLSRRRPRC